MSTWTDTVSIIEMILNTRHPSQGPIELDIELDDSVMTNWPEH